MTREETYRLFDVVTNIADTGVIIDQQYLENPPEPLKDLPGWWVLVDRWPIDHRDKPGKVWLHESQVVKIKPEQAA